MAPPSRRRPAFSCSLAEVIEAEVPEVFEQRRWAKRDGVEVRYAARRGAIALMRKLTKALWPTAPSSPPSGCSTSTRWPVYEPPPAVTMKRTKPMP